MQRYTVPQRVKVIEIYYRNQLSIRRTFRALREIHGPNNRPTEATIRRIVSKFEATGSVENLPTPRRRRSARSLENIAAVRENVQETPKLSILRRSQELGLSPSSVWRILHLDLKLHPYKIQLTQELKPNDHLMRRRFANWALENLEANPNFAQNIIFSDEAHFWLNGFVNKQNCRIWSEANPREILETPLHPEKITVWCGFWSGGIIGPYFFENEQGRAVTVNGERYRRMIRNFLWPRLQEIDLANIFFQQDGATCHTARETLDLLAENFQGRTISRNGDFNWPARSCDLTPLDFFLWGYVKSLVYENKPRTIEALRDNIVRVITEIEPDICQKVITNWTSRLHAVRQSRGGHLPDVIFHT